MNKTADKHNRNKLLSIRIDEKLLADCLKHFKNDLSTRSKFGYVGSYADLVEYCLKQYIEREQK